MDCITTKKPLLNGAYPKDGYDSIVLRDASREVQNGAILDFSLKPRKTPAGRRFKNNKQEQ